jgi:hypothetical protein
VVITSALHAEGRGFKPRLLYILYTLCIKKKNNNKVFFIYMYKTKNPGNRNRTSDLEISTIFTTVSRSTS